VSRAAAVTVFAIFLVALTVATVTRTAVAHRRPAGAPQKPPPAPVGRHLSPRGRSLAAIRQVFGRGELAACMLRVAWRESRLEPRAANWSDRHSDGSHGSFGLFQIGAVHRAHGELVEHFARRMFEPAPNARVARTLFAESGLLPWGGYC